MQYFNGISGQYCDFKSPLSEGEFFAIPAESSLPEGVKPVIDKSSGLCIGYLYGMNNIYHLYDIKGYYQGVHTFPPESALFGPLDLLLVSAILTESDRQTYFLMRNGTLRVVSSGSIILNMQIIPILKSRHDLNIKRKIKYAPLAARAMTERSRYIPDYILDRAIKKGRQIKIATTVYRENLLTYSLQIKKFSSGGQCRDINLTVIVDTDKEIIKEFSY